MFWAPIAIGAGLGLAKTISGNSQAAEERKRQAAIARWSPWTGLQPHTVQDQDLFGNALTGAAGGAVLGQGLKGMGGAEDMGGVGEFTTSGDAATGAAPSLGVAGAAPTTSNFSLMNSVQSPYSVMGAGGMPAVGSAGALGGAEMSPWAELLKKKSSFGA